MQKHPRMTIRYQSWSLFRDQVLSNTLNLDGIDCIFGGADLAVDLTFGSSSPMVIC
jgi:hypothetical protein